MSSIAEAMQVIKQYAPNFTANVGLILGSGLATAANEISQAVAIPYQDIPGLQVSQVPGHPSQLILGHWHGVPVACLKGRLHLYEGTSYKTLQLLVRLLKSLGCRMVIITGAAGSLRETVGPGELMLINDHINMQNANPLIGPNDDAIGPRFVSLENAYDTVLSSKMSQLAAKLAMQLHEGIYLATTGPVFETVAEIKAFRMLGADAVGMSVVPEVLLARHAGMAVIGIAAITNFAVGLSKEKITHELTLASSETLSHKLRRLISNFLLTNKSSLV
jgi:xanthosine phosphorylase